jgi:hypothetical protein
LDHVYSGDDLRPRRRDGLIDAADPERIYDAGDPAGLCAYQEWIQFKPACSPR